MGIDYGIYVGPYVTCLVTVVEVTRTRRACANRSCPNHQREMRDAYCALCGSPVRPVEYTEAKQSVDTWVLSVAINETLTTASGDAYRKWSREHNAHLWKVTVSTGERSYHLESPEDFAFFEITPEQIVAEMVAFREQFAAELTLFRKHYGAAMVYVRWGVIQDYT